MRSPEAGRRLRRNPGSLGHQESGSGRKMTLQKPGCPSRKKDEGSGHQKTGWRRKLGALEAQKASGKQSGRSDGKKSSGTRQRPPGRDETGFQASAGSRMVRRRPSSAQRASYLILRRNSRFHPPGRATARWRTTLSDCERPPRPGINARATLETKSRLKPAPKSEPLLQEPGSPGFSVQA